MYFLEQFLALGAVWHAGSLLARLRRELGKALLERLGLSKPAYLAKLPHANERSGAQTRSVRRSSLLVLAGRDRVGYGKDESTQPERPRRHSLAGREEATVCAADPHGLAPDSLARGALKAGERESHHGKRCVLDSVNVIVTC
jgi:hypothetical protein